MPNQWRAQTRDNICASRHFSDFMGEFCLGKKDLFGTGYPLVWYTLKQLSTSMAVNSGSVNN